jgi:hypothetical protein
MTVYDALHSVLNYECQVFYCDEWRTLNHGTHIKLSYEWIATLLKLPGGPKIGHHLKICYSVFGDLLPSNWMSHC